MKGGEFFYFPPKPPHFLPFFRASALGAAEIWGGDGGDFVKFSPHLAPFWGFLGGWVWAVFIGLARGWMFLALVVHPHPNPPPKGEGILGLGVGIGYGKLNAPTKGLMHLL